MSVMARMNRNTVINPGRPAGPRRSAAAGNSASRFKKVQDGARPGSRRCFGADCPVTVKPTRLFCSHGWVLVSAATKADLFRALLRGEQEAFQAAVAAAQGEIAAAGGCAAGRRREGGKV